MAYEVVMPYHLHMPSYFLETFTEYPKINKDSRKINPAVLIQCFEFSFYSISTLCFTGERMNVNS